jgi:hypothetical protein
MQSVYAATGSGVIKPGLQIVLSEKPAKNAAGFAEP